MKVFQAVADLYIVSNELAGLPEGDWTQKMINTLQPILTTIDDACAPRHQRRGRSSLRKGLQ